MIAREKCTWFGYVLAASFLSSLWLMWQRLRAPFVADGTAFPREPTHREDKRGPRCCRWSQPTANPRSPTCWDLSTSQARLCERASAADMNSPGQCWLPKKCKPIPNAHIEFWLATLGRLRRRTLEGVLPILLLALSHMFHGSSKPPQTSL